MSDAYIIPVTKKKRNKKTLEIETVTKYRCFYCKRMWDTVKKARGCVESHDLVLIPLSATDLARLLTFIYTKESKLISQNLVRLLKQYARQKARTS